jgi:hypothetical protein
VAATTITAVVNPQASPQGVLIDAALSTPETVTAIVNPQGVVIAATVMLQGPAGISAGSYVHTQNTAADTWHINHNMHLWPSVDVVDSSGHLVEGDVFYTDADNIIVYFSAPFAGRAFLNGGTGIGTGTSAPPVTTGGGGGNPPSGGGGGGTTQAPATGTTFGWLVGVKDAVNKIFTLPVGSGTVIVIYLNGFAGEAFTQLNSTTVEMHDPPYPNDTLAVLYQQ